MFSGNITWTDANRKCNIKGTTLFSDSKNIRCQNLTSQYLRKRLWLEPHNTFSWMKPQGIINTECNMKKCCINPKYLYHPQGPLSFIVVDGQTSKTSELWLARENRKKTNAAKYDYGTIDPVNCCQSFLELLNVVLISHIIYHRK